MKSTHLDRRRTQHTGVLSDGRWSAHGRGNTCREGAGQQQTRGFEVNRRLSGARSPAAQTGARTVNSSADHGTMSRYWLGCRCDRCRAANAARCRALRAKRMSKPIPNDVPHGLSTATNYGCKCAVCRDAVRTSNRRISERAAAGEIVHVRGGTHPNCPCPSCKAAHRKYNAAKSRQLNDESLHGATRRFYVWTSAELEIASRPDLTAKQVAQMLGRSVSAVTTVRGRIKSGEPKILNLLGASNDRVDN